MESQSKTNEVGSWNYGFGLFCGSIVFFFKITSANPACSAASRCQTQPVCAQGVETEAERKEVETGTCSVAMQTGTTVCPAQD